MATRHWEFSALDYLLSSFCLLATAAAAIQLFVRSWRSTGEEREQYKWLGFAAGLLVLSLPFAAITNWEGLGAIPFVIALIALPISVAIAVLKYRLYDIDILINRTLVYVPLTAIVIGLYTALVGVLKTIATDVTETNTDAAVAATTLLIVAVLTPLKNQLQVLVDHHFKERRDPLAKTRNLTTQASAVLQVLERERFVQTFLADLTADLDATGARVDFQTTDERLAWFTGSPTGGPILAVPLARNGRRIGSLSVWLRQIAPLEDGPRSEAVAEAALVLAQVLSLAPGPQSMPPEVVEAVMPEAIRDSGGNGLDPSRTQP